jgi:hypothetical protein
MGSDPSTWRLWLPFPRRYGPTDERILNGLNIGERAYRLFKMIHISVSILPVAVTVGYQQRHHELDLTSKGFVASLVATVGLYYLLANFIDVVWSGMNSRQ